MAVYCHRFLSNFSATLLYCTHGKGQWQDHPVPTFPCFCVFPSLISAQSFFSPFIESTKCKEQSPTFICSYRLPDSIECPLGTKLGMAEQLICCYCYQNNNPNNMPHSFPQVALRRCNMSTSLFLVSFSTYLPTPLNSAAPLQPTIQMTHCQVPFLAWHIRKQAFDKVRHSNFPVSVWLNCYSGCM